MNSEKVTTWNEYLCAQLLKSPGLPLLERLRVLLTASDILRGQGEALNVDRRESHTRLYQVSEGVLYAVGKCEPAYTQTLVPGEWGCAVCYA